MEPVYAFDREIIPAGTLVLGKVSRTQPVTKWQRFRLILGGDFTPLRTAQVEFTTLKLPDGRTLPSHTIETMGLNSIYNPWKSQPQAQNGGILGTAKQRVKDRISTATGTLNDIRGPNKKEKLVDFLWTKAPYHPQYWRRNTRFDAPLRDPLDFGSATIKPEDLSALGTQPAPDSVGHVRLLTELNSADAKQGAPVEAVVTAPLFSKDHKLLLPEGTKLTGEVVLARRARHFHRAGQLRFTFQKVDLPQQALALRESAPPPAMLKTQAVLQAAEGAGKTPIKVDSEGGVQAKESKTRFLAPAISFAIASASNYEGRHQMLTNLENTSAAARMSGAEPSAAA
jgi:hypothetical protein